MPETVAPSATGRRKLRIAILAEGEMTPCWIIDTFSAALALPNIDLVGVYHLVSSTSGSWAARMFRRLDRLGRGASSPYEADLAAALGALRLGRVSAKKLGERFELDDGAIRQLKDQKLDLVLCCASAPFCFLPGIARYGAWGLEIGYGVSAAAAWAGAAELAGNSPITLTRIVDYSEAIARELHVAACGETMGSSVRRNRLKAISSSGAVMRRLLERLNDGSDNLRQLPRLLPLPKNYPREVSPTMGLLARTCFRMGSALLGNRLRRNARDDRWHIAYDFSDLPLPNVAFDRLRYLAPAPDTFWADPFPLVHEGRHYIFFEELPYRTGVGRLLAIEVFEDRAAGAPMIVLERNHHLSYPHVFDWQGQLYMVPETKNARRVELLRCVEFPSRWELCKVMLDDILAVDATLWHQDETWWMFVNVALEDGATADELHLYFADSLHGEWTPHPANPLCADVGCSRPAGPLFSADGKVFRPSQDSARRYGHALCINQIEQLDRTSYVERSVSRIAPDWHPDVRCVHTLGRSGRLTVLDCAIDDRGSFRAEAASQASCNLAFNA
jgi:hypothetical protein